MAQTIILVVDDDEGIRETLSAILTLDGYITYSASNGLEALKLLEDCKLPCVILLDLMMPVMNGAQFIQALKEKCSPHNKIPILMITAFGKQYEQMGIEADLFLTKPFDIGTLLEAVRRYCRK
jgi:CheY-like chemotaxis protein